MSVLELSSTNTVFFVDLPDPCLLVVLQCSPDDPAGLCSAARAHSRLQCQCKCISADVYQQKQVARVLMYARKYSHVHIISLQGAATGQGTQGTSATRRPSQQHAAKIQNPFSSLPRHNKAVCMPTNLQLHALHLDSVVVQLQPGGGSAWSPGCAGLRDRRVL